MMTSAHSLTDSKTLVKWPCIWRRTRLSLWLVIALFLSALLGSTSKALTNLYTSGTEDCTELNAAWWIDDARSDFATLSTLLSYCFFCVAIWEKHIENGRRCYSKAQGLRQYLSDACHPERWFDKISHIELVGAQARWRVNQKPETMRIEERRQLHCCCNGTHCPKMTN